MELELLNELLQASYYIPFLIGYSNFDTIQKMAYASEGDSADTSYDLTVARKGGHGHNSDTHGYVSGGYNSDVIDRWSFASEAHALDVGDLVGAWGSGVGHSSTTHGWVSGYGYLGTTANVEGGDISKFAWASSSNAADTGDLDKPRGCSTANGVQH